MKGSLPAQVFASVVLAAVLGMAGYSGELYESLMQEDGFLEWLTAALFALSGAIRLRIALKERRPFDGLVAVFCLFVAGEEFSWGQRLVGYTPPEWFLAHNTQQEATLHNFAAVFGRPKWSLIAVLFGYGIMLPLLARAAWANRVLERVRATPPPVSLLPWFALTIILLLWYPLDYTGEWVELMVAGLFLGAATTASAFAACVATGSLLAVILTAVSRQRSGGEASLSCARLEVANLTTDIVQGAATPDLLAARSVDERIWTAVGNGEVDPAGLSRFGSTRCDVSISVSRRRYAVDPWGSSYWLTVNERPDGLADIKVYSLGPNRRRDRDDVVGGASVDILSTPGDSVPPDRSGR